MPPFNFHRRRWYSNWPYRRRRYTTRRRPRQTIRRRFRRRFRVRRRRRRFKRHKKLLKLRLNQWQPKKIRKCTIEGLLCTIQCGRGKVNHNFTLDQELYVNEGEPGGGSWSIMQVTLRVLYEEYLACRNWWTAGNQGLPLTRYLGGYIKLYRSQQTDYIATINTCPPFEVTRDSYFGTQPSRLIMNKYKIIVPKLSRTHFKKPYIKKRIYPPSMFQNKWYFQKDLYNQPLFMITTSCCSLGQVFSREDEINSNITLMSLNTDFFQNPQWSDLPTLGYRPKYSGTTNTYLFVSHNGNETVTGYKNLIPLLQTKRLTDGKELPQQPTNAFENIGNQKKIKEEYWGNPFNPKYLHSHRYVYGPYPTEENYTKTVLTQLHELFFSVRYNPFRDKGKGNKIYIKSTSLPQSSYMVLPTNENLLVENLPIWLVLYAWEDWLLKSKPVQHLYQDYQLVIQTDYFYPKRQCYVILDKYFWDAQNDSQHPLTETDKANWHPKLEMQEYSTEKIATTGPLAPKINFTKNIEAHILYKLFFKWGGCPAPMEQITDPADQEKFPTPSNFIPTIEIQDPETPEQYTLWEWDQRRDMLTGKATKRIKLYQEPTNYFTEYGAKDPETQTPQVISYEAPEQGEKKEKEYIAELQQLQRDLKQRIHRLLKNPKLFPF
nr:MAG: ORF1 [TTV-like mini virus]